MQFTDEQQRFIDEHYQLLPKDGDGVTIRVGDTLDGYGKTIEVVEMRYGRGGWVLISRDGSGYAGTFAFGHHAPDKPADTPASLADELEAWCDSVDVDGDACDKPRDIVERIRKLAAKEDK